MGKCVKRHKNEHKYNLRSRSRQTHDDHKNDHKNNGHINGGHINDGHKNDDHINDDHINDDHRIIPNEETCEEMSIDSTQNANNNNAGSQLNINANTKLTKMPNKCYELRKRGPRLDSSSHAIQHKSDMQLNDLPDDCLLLILHHLGSIKNKSIAERVCKRFKFLVGRLFKAQKTFSANTAFGEAHVDDQKLTKSMCKNVIAKCPNLSQFKMPGFYTKEIALQDRISDEEMIVLGNTCNGLKDLEICGCGNITEYGINIIIKRCPELEKLSISFCQKITGHSFAHLSNKFKRLTLNANEYTPSVEESLNALKDGDGKHLEELNLSLFHIIESQEEILELICTHFIKIECLRYSVISRIPTKFGILSKLKNLTELAFDADSYNLDDTEFIRIMEGCSKLTHLFIRIDCQINSSVISDYSLRKLPTFCPQMRKLQIHSKTGIITSITDSSILSLVQLKHLESLSFKCFENIGDSVIKVIKSCSKLNYLCLINCMKVTNGTLLALISAAKLQPSKRFKFNISGDNIKRRKRSLPFNLIDCSNK